MDAGVWANTSLKGQTFGGCFAKCPDSPAEANSANACATFLAQPRQDRLSVLTDASFPRVPEKSCAVRAANAK